MDFLSKILFRSAYRNIDRLLDDIRSGKPVPKTKPDPRSGVLFIEDSRLKYASPDYGSWEIPVSEIVAFGEYTTDNGPMIDDWFMVFVTRDLDWVEASNYCEGRDDIRDHLAEAWKTEHLYGELWGRTNFNSRVIWPEALSGKPLFDFTKRSQSLWDKIKSFGEGIIDKELTPAVRNHLQPPANA